MGNSLGILESDMIPVPFFKKAFKDEIQILRDLKKNGITPPLFVFERVIQEGFRICISFLQESRLSEEERNFLQLFGYGSTSFVYPKNYRFSDFPEEIRKHFDSGEMRELFADFIHFDSRQESIDESTDSVLQQMMRRAIDSIASRFDAHQPDAAKKELQELFETIKSVYAKNPNILAKLQDFFMVLPQQIQDLTVSDWVNKITAYLKVEEISPEWLSFFQQYVFQHPLFKDIQDIETNMIESRVEYEHSEGAKIRNDFLRVLIQGGVEAYPEKSRLAVQVCSLHEMLLEIANAQHARRSFILYHDNHYNVVDMVIQNGQPVSIVVMDAAADPARDRLIMQLNRRYPLAEVFCIGLRDGSDAIQKSSDACGFFSFDHAWHAMVQEDFHEHVREIENKTPSIDHPEQVFYVPWSSMDPDFIKHVESFKTLTRLVENQPSLSASPVNLGFLRITGTPTQTLEEYIASSREMDGVEKKLQNKSMQRFREKCLDFLKKKIGITRLWSMSIDSEVTTPLHAITPVPFSDHASRELSPLPQVPSLFSQADQKSEQKPPTPSLK